MTSAELIYKPREFQQIRHAEQRTMLPYDDLRVRSHEIRPLLRDRADCPIIVLQQETRSIEVAPLAHAKRAACC